MGNPLCATQLTGDWIGSQFLPFNTGDVLGNRIGTFLKCGIPDSVRAVSKTRMEDDTATNPISLELEDLSPRCSRPSSAPATRSTRR